ncbi:RNA polymerase sigma-70 factor [Fulvivirgaceae bacterium BMA12]|uniref:RNA polymerase sigma-70 factor n=1 Tax=Agaribacillus aureus TaxID=3051825 RepID=A0ABT8L6A8_9BACT|nr:RNA polymerase sigma-70 factor [Fulvivirgaceae bacterium BMA12]
MIDKLTDNIQLFRKFIEEDDLDAFERIYKMYEKQLGQYAFQFTKSRFISDEIIQDVFFKLWLHRKSLRKDGNIKAYLYRMVRNRSLNYIRDAVQHEDLAEVLKKDALRARDQADDLVISMDLDNLMDSILERLPERKRNIYQLSRQQGKSNGEIAKQLGITIKTVENHIWEALLIIKKHVERHLYLILALLTIF